MDDQISQNGTEKPAPEQVLIEMLTGSIVTKLIHVAAKLGIADELKEGPKSSDDIAVTIDAHPRSLYRFMRTLASLGIFAELEQGTFKLTPLSESLRSDVSNSMRSAAILMGDECVWRSQGELLHSVKTGETAFEHVFGMGFFEYFNKNNKAAEVFNDMMTSLTYQDIDAVLAAYDFSWIKTIVDVGGGHGILISAILKAYPQLQGILAELPSVLDGAEKRLMSEGVENRCQRIATDFFKAVPAGGDAYILRDIIHDWNDEKSIAILKNCHHQMNDKSRLLLIEKVIPPGNDPDAGKILDIEMMLYTGGLERTANEYTALMNQAGFELTKIVPTHGLPSVIEGRPV